METPFKHSTDREITAAIKDTGCQTILHWMTTGPMESGVVTSLDSAQRLTTLQNATGKHTVSWDLLLVPNPS